MGLKNSKAARYEKHNINVDLKNVYFEDKHGTVISQPPPVKKEEAKEKPKKEDPTKSNLDDNTLKKVVDLVYHELRLNKAYEQIDIFTNPNNCETNEKNAVKATHTLHNQKSGLENVWKGDSTMLSANAIHFTTKHAGIEIWNLHKNSIQKFAKINTKDTADCASAKGYFNRKFSDDFKVRECQNKTKGECIKLGIVKPLDDELKELLNGTKKIEAVKQFCADHTKLAVDYTDAYIKLCNAENLHTDIDTDLTTLDAWLA